MADAQGDLLICVNGFMVGCFSGGILLLQYLLLVIFIKLSCCILSKQFAKGITESTSELSMTGTDFERPAFVLEFLWL